MRYPIKEMGVGGILDVAVRLFKDHFGLLMRITFYLMIPFSLVHGLVVYAITPQLHSGVTTEQMMEMAPALAIASLVNLGLALVFGLIVSPVTNAATISALASEYLDRPATAGESVRFAFRILWKLIITNFLAGVLIMLGFVLFIIPGIYLAFRYWLTSHVVALEGKSGSDALKRSGALMKGNMGKAFVLGLLLAVIGMMVGMIVGLIPVPIMQVVVNVLVRAVLFAVGTAAGVVFYFSARCKLEHFDLMVLAEAVGREEEPPPAGGPA